ncbi:MAG TPA: histidine ammonia-lyase [Egibacteraceae bacterium]|nr:histidine ammonia-lyase [Egibacteraceae bacterium]
MLPPGIGAAGRAHVIIRAQPLTKELGVTIPPTGQTANPPHEVEVGRAPLSLDDLISVARHGANVRLSADARAQVEASRRLVEGHLGEDRAIYGLNTGFGALADVRIAAEDNAALQINLVRSHAAGVGDLLPAEVVRGMMLVRAKTLAAGYSGVRPLVVERLVDLLNAGVCPAVPDRGSVGCSGDLAQLAHIALCLVGEGRALRSGGGTEASTDALARAGVSPIALAEKEGLALINGTDGMLTVGALAHADSLVALRSADIAAAMSVEASNGTDRPFAAEIQALRPHPGQAASAANLRRLLDASSIVASHRDSEHAVQDAYSFRCAPQVHGAARDVHAFAGEVLERELQSVIDNPVVLPDGRVESNGNFHGEPLAYAADALAIGISGAANISERRTLWLLGPAAAQRGLPAFLAVSPGLQSGYMLAQYTQAALVSECKVLGTPASLDSIPTSNNQEDHNSMGWLSAMKLRRVVELVTTVVAIEALCAAQALDLRRPAEPAPATAAARAAMREAVPFLDADREIAADIAAATDLVRRGGLAGAVEQLIGPLA